MYTKHIQLCISRYSAYCFKKIMLYWALQFNHMVHTPFSNDGSVLLWRLHDSFILNVPYVKFMTTIVIYVVQRYLVFTCLWMFTQESYIRLTSKFICSFFVIIFLLTLVYGTIYWIWAIRVSIKEKCQIKKCFKLLIWKNVHWN